MCKKTLAHCYVNSPYTIFVTNTHTHTHTHTLTCAHTHAHAHTQTGLVTLAVTLGSYFSHCLYVHECRHMCTHTCTHTHTQRLGLYHLQRFYKAYMCMHEHTYTHVHTHSTTCSDFGFLFLTLSLFSQSVHVHECNTLVQTLTSPFLEM